MTYKTHHELWQELFTKKTVDSGEIRRILAVDPNVSPVPVIAGRGFHAAG